MFFFPVPAPNGASPSPAFRRGRSKKRCFFFAVAPPKGRGAHGAQTKKKHSAHPGTTAKNILESNDTGHEQKGTTKIKKRLTHCGPGRRCSLTCFPGRLFRPGPAGVFFLLRPRVDAHSLTAGLGGDASRRGGAFLFLLRPRPDRGGVCLFFLLRPRPDAHSLTVGWGDFGKARVVLVFFALRPRRTRRANKNKCLVYYIGSKKTRRGHSKKKKKTPLPGLLLSSTL